MKNIFFLTVLLAVGLIVAPSWSFAQEQAAPEKSILRVNVTSQRYNFALPWQKRSPSSRRGLGALLTEARILVTAELAQDASYIELELPASGKKLTAKVAAVDYEANLALIVPDEEPGDFFEGMVPLEVDLSTKVGDQLEVWQFEENGTPVTTAIKVSRVEIGRYFLDDAYFLEYEASGAVQYRAGSFTLPVVREGKLAGMLLSYSAKDQVADILAAPIIDHFLKDVADAPYDGFPNFGVKYSMTLDEQLRGYLKLDDTNAGVLVTGVIAGTSAEKAGIKKGDVILKVKGLEIDSRGNYKDPVYGLLNLSHLVKGSVSVGEEISVTVLRDGEEMDITVKLIRKNPSEYLVDPYMFDRGPKYQIVGGLLFQELTIPYLKLAGKDWRTRAPFKLIHAATNPKMHEDAGRKKIVFLSGVLPSNTTLGYENLSALIVDKVNDKAINELKDLDEALKTPADGVHKIEFGDFPHRIYVDAKQAEEDNNLLMPDRYRISELKRLE